MSNPQDELIRAFINWIIPSALGGAIMHMATKVLHKEQTFLEALISAVICFLFACLSGTMAHLWKADMGTIIGVTAFSAVVGVRVVEWFMYKFDIHTFLADLVKGFAEWLVKRFK